MNLDAEVVSVRARQLPGTVRALRETAPSGPLLVATCVAAVIVVQAGSNAHVLVPRLRVVDALIAAAAGFVLDDSAAVTLASSPTPLAARRAVRVAATLVAIACWWVCAAAFVGVRTGHAVPFGIGFLELATLTLVSLTAAAWAARRSDDDRGGMAGAVLALACYATVYLPPRWWWPMTADLGGPDAARRLVVTLLTATTILVAASLDPARPPLLTRHH